MNWYKKIIAQQEDQMQEQEAVAENLANINTAPINPIAINEDKKDMNSLINKMQMPADAKGQMGQAMTSGNPRQIDKIHGFVFDSLLNNPGNIAAAKEQSKLYQMREKGKTNI